MKLQKQAVLTAENAPEAAAAPFSPLPQPQFEWIVTETASDEWQASGMCASLEEARREASHYAAQYLQDTPVSVEIREVRTVLEQNLGRIEPVYESEPDFARGKPDGYYLVGARGDLEWSLVYLYWLPSRSERVISFGHQDGGSLLTLSDFDPETTVLVPAHVEPASARATTLRDLEGVDFSGQVRLVGLNEAGSGSAVDALS